MTGTGRRAENMKAIGEMRTNGDVQADEEETLRGTKTDQK